MTASEYVLDVLGGASVLKAERFRHRPNSIGESSADSRIAHSNPFAIVGSSCSRPPACSTCRHGP